MDTNATSLPLREAVAKAMFEPYARRSWDDPGQQHLHASWLDLADRAIETLRTVQSKDSLCEYLYSGAQSDPSSICGFVKDHPIHAQGGRDFRHAFVGRVKQAYRPVSQAEVDAALEAFVPYTDDESGDGAALAMHEALEAAFRIRNSGWGPSSD